MTVPLYAQEAYVLPRLTGPVQLDGRNDEPAWHAVEPLPHTMYEPTYNGTTTEQTEMRAAYDDEYLYFSGSFYDDDASGIRVNTLYRDDWNGDDTFGIILDTFNDNENALWFWVTPAGVRSDVTIAKDAAQGGLNGSWNTYWDVATVQNEQGWFTEVRIPFSSLGFQDFNGQATMGLILYRLISRKNERHIFPAISQEWKFYKPSQAQDVILEGVQSKKPVYVTPYALGGVAQTAQLNPNQSAYRPHRDFTQELGFDVKYNVTSNLTLDATLNTDFAQAEADDQQVNLTRFSLFFPEKRQFFQERAGIFDFRTGSQDQLFHSRRIGLSDTGAPVRILGGARLIGRVDDWDVGLIDMQTGRSQGLPSENFGVFRLRRRLFNANSFLGGLLTSRLGEDGSYNVALGLDGIVRVHGDEYLTIKGAATYDDDIVENEAFNLGTSSLLSVRWERRGIEGLSYSAKVERFGSAYQPGMGFVRRTNVTSVSGALQYGHFLSAQSPLRRVTPQLLGDVFFRNEDGAVESVVVWPIAEILWKSGADLWIGPSFSFDDLQEPLQLPEGNSVPPGDYFYYDVSYFHAMPEGRTLRVNSEWLLGTFFDGWRMEAAVKPSWSVSRFLGLSGEYILNVVRFPKRDQGFDAHLARLRVQAALNTKLSVNAFVQYSSAIDNVTANMRFRYNFREGNDLWIVYNHGLNTDRRGFDPALLLTNDRTLLVKYTHTFVF